MARTNPAIALTIAGSDSGGGAGIQADLKTFHQFRVYGTSVITAITAQNTRGVTGYEAVSNGLIRLQIDAVATDLRPAALKSGMLADAAIVETVAEGIRAHALGPYVLDPVMVATSGDALLTLDAVDAIRRLLFPLATLVTPNLDEAALLVGGVVDDVPSMRAAARQLVHEFGAVAALVKGGHLRGDLMTDVLYANDTFVEVEHPRIDTTSTHGTGCTLSSAITAQLARGDSLEVAVRGGLAFVHAAIRSAPGLGDGHGPLDHFAAPPQGA
jgi:hydroxymethylpyrimidine/phosphomethylpyrimidine kinase